MPRSPGLARGAPAPTGDPAPCSPSLPLPSRPRPTRLSVATSSSSAAGPPARPSPRCSPSTGRDVVAAREGAPPALSHRRVAAAGQRRRCSTGSACASRSRRSACRSTASSSSRPSTSIASSSSSARPGTSRCRTPGRCAARSSTRSCFATPARKGARTFEGCRVREVAFDADGATVQVELDDGAAAQLARPLRRRRIGPRHACSPTSCAASSKNPRHNSSALYGHFTGAERLPGKLEGNITIFWFEHGWFWFIPLADGTTSVGAVCWPYYLKSRDEAAARVLPRHDRAVPRRSTKRLAGRQARRRRASTRPATTRTRARTSSGERYLMIGDAFAFVDPVFSSGVLPGDAERVRRRRRRRGGARRPARRGSAARARSTAACSAVRASSRGSSSASPTRRCASSSWRRRTRSASRKR